MVPRIHRTYCNAPKKQSHNYDLIALPIPLRTMVFVDLIPMEMFSVFGNTCCSHNGKHFCKKLGKSNHGGVDSIIWTKQLNWLHKTILRLSHLFQISWALALFYKSIFKTTFSYFFNITLKTYLSSVST